MLDLKPDIQALGRTEPLAPFGVMLRAAPGQTLADLDPEAVKALILEHRIVVLRGFPIVGAKALEDEAARYGELLSWNFGNVLELVVHEEPKNYLFTRGAVPYHWDGAFAAAVPAIQLFQCLEAPDDGAGGETIFCDTVQVLRKMGDEARQRLGGVEIAYATDKLAHYGGAIRRAPLAAHPITGEPTLRFAEPVIEDGALNPVYVELDKDGERLTDEAQAALLAWLTPRLYADDVVYAHPWVEGDYLLADNHALLHGRAAFDKSLHRHLRRIHIL